MSKIDRTQVEAIDAASGGEFEDGSEGHRPGENGSGISSLPDHQAGESKGSGGRNRSNHDDKNSGTVNDQNAVTANSLDNNFTGRILIEEDHVILVSGGIRVEVLTSGDIPSSEGAASAEERQPAISIFSRYQNQNITLQGIQRGDFILGARFAGLAADRDFAPAELKNSGDDFSGLDPKIRETFAKIKEVIKSESTVLLNNPNVVSVRPGFQFANGWITGNPAIVVSVRRKIAAPFLEKSALLPTSLAGFPVDVKAASPLELVLAKTGIRGSNETAKSLIGTKLSEFNSLLSSLSRESTSTESVLVEAEGITEAVSDIGYRKPTGVHLDEVIGPMTVTCNVSPDAGWTTLSQFLDNTSDRLTIAMYDFTAPHIVQRLRSAMSHAGGVLKLILGPNESLGTGTKADDFPEKKVIERLEQALKQRFEHLFAVVSGRHRVFANSYHIKVAVRDGRAFWLSSGNWQSSNQPNLDPLGADANLPGILQTYNRDWHVVVEHAGLARTFEQFIEWDMQLSDEAGGSSEEAAAQSKAQLPDLFVPEEYVALEVEERATAARPRYFQPARFTFTAQRPLRVQPLLTPDNYAEHVLRHIQSAREKLYFQNQSISILENNQPQFNALLDALLKKSKTIDDVRIIVRSEFGAREMVESLRLRGFASSKIKVQARCHTKGIIVDSKAVLIGSHNWTNSGTLYNRDASLIFFDEGIAKYYEEIFLYDWEHLAHQQVRESVSPVPVDDGEEAAPAGMVRVPWNAFYEDLD